MRVKDEFGSIGDFASGESPFADSETEFSDISPNEEIEEGKSMAVLAYVPILCLIPFMQSRETNKFAYAHAQQGMLIFVFEIIAILGALFWKAALFLAALASLVGIVFVLQGRTWKVPLIGEFTDKIETLHREQKAQK